MENILQRVLQGREDNHMLPFLWLHGEDPATAGASLDEIAACGIREVCVESRTHPDFCGDGWWAYMDILLAEAEARGMGVWIMDAKHYPTGDPNGLIRDKYPEDRPWHAIVEAVDVAGSRMGASVLLSEDAAGEEILSAFAYPRDEKVPEAISLAPINLKSCIRGRWITFDVPDGVWRVCMVTKTRRGAMPGQEDRVDMVSSRSVHRLIEGIYEPHYARYKRYFGSVIRGFFSDEPRFGNNILNAYLSNSLQTIGSPTMALPWSEDVARRMERELGRDPLPLLPALWFEAGSETPAVRNAYMNAVTNLWRENFSMGLGDWCRARGVGYIGHIIEDNNASTHLCYSAGHFYRALDGQDMAGIDIVLHQFIPGMAAVPTHTGTSYGHYCDTAFYHAALAQMAQTHALLNPRMGGRAMCECFGAFGWAEGVPFMKRMLDHLLLEGINYFVPHAFTPLYPDPDCPPHFNAGGHNPEFAAFGALMRYGNRMATLLEGAIPVFSCGVLYAAEAEWSGRRFTYSEVPAKALLDDCLDYGILPADALAAGRTENGALRAGMASFPCIVVPGCEWLPEDVLANLRNAQNAGVDVVFTDFAPGADWETVPLSDLPSRVRRAGHGDLSVKADAPLLRAAHYRRDGGDLFLFLNESANHRTSADITLPATGCGARIDLLQRQTTALSAPDGHVRLTLDAGEMAVLAFGFDGMEADAAFLPAGREEIRPVWEISVADADDLSHFVPYKETGELFDINRPGELPDFSGSIRYRAKFMSERAPRAISLGQVGSSCQVQINGEDAGWFFAKPFVVPVTRGRRGENEIEITVATTLVRKHPDRFSHFLASDPAGLLGPVEALY